MRTALAALRLANGAWALIQGPRTQLRWAPLLRWCGAGWHATLPRRRGSASYLLVYLNIPPVTGLPDAHMYKFSHVVCYTFVLYMMLAAGYKHVLASSEWL